MSKELITKQSLIDWCDQQVAQGNKLSMAWEGGGDSGWVYFKINDEQVSDSAETSEMQELIELMYDQLDYGSWAGEFSASGEADYDPDQKAFEGTDYYSEDDTYNMACDIKIKISKELWFDAFEYNMEDEDTNIQTHFHIRNGFLTPEHDEALEKIQKDLTDEVEHLVDRFRNNPANSEYRNVWQNDVINRADFTDEGDYLIYTIEDLAIGTYVSNDKYVFLQLTPDNDE